MSSSITAKQVAFFAGQDLRAWDPWPHHLHNWKFGGGGIRGTDRLGIAGSDGNFLLRGGFLIASREESSLVGSLRTSCCSLTASLWRIRCLAFI